MTVHAALLLQNQLASRRADLERLNEVLQSPKVPECDTIAGVFNRKVSPLLVELEEVARTLQAVDWRVPWSRLRDIQRRTEPLLRQAQEFLGSVLLRDFSLECEMSQRAQSLAKEYATRMGVEWSPVVVFAQPMSPDNVDLTDENSPEDRIVRLPVPHWDFWHLPLIAHDYGYWIARHGQIQSFDDWVSKRAVERREIHLWNLIADAIAVFTVGPAYAYTLLFLRLDPTRAFTDRLCLPSDASRAAAVLQILERTDVEARPDAFTEGPYTSEVKLLQELWHDALDCAGNLQASRDLEAGMQADWKSLHAALTRHFGVQARQTIQSWQAAKTQVVPLIRDGGALRGPVALDTLVNAAWFCRTRHADRISDIANRCERLLAGKDQLQGLSSKPPDWSRPASRLLHSRLHDLGSDLGRFTELLGSDKIGRQDRAAVAGRLYRLLSDQDYGLKKLRKLTQNVAALSSSLSQVIDRCEGGPMAELRSEVLDFLGGVLVRQAGLDQGICAVAEVLLRDFAASTGVNWSSRAVLGRNPLFSEPTGLIHLRFPDWDIWNLPLMAHEFGHVTALATPAFRDLLARELAMTTQGHPEAGAWTDAQKQSYSAERERHLHEFFADSFAVYCLGPAFVYDVAQLQFNPAEAYLARGDHPTHAERMVVILRVLTRMNQEEAADVYDAGPYVSVLARLKNSWAEAAGAPPAELKEIAQFLRLKATDLADKIHDLLDRYYRMGAQYRAARWHQAEQDAPRLLQGNLDLSQRSLRDLVSLSWAARVQYPDRALDMARIIGKACAARAAQDGKG